MRRAGLVVSALVIDTGEKGTRAFPVSMQGYVIVP